jgi:integrase
VETGVRLSEALRLRWTDVQGLEHDVCVIRLHRTKEIKNNKARSIPLTAVGMAILQEIRGEGGRPIGPFQDLTKDRAERVWNAAKKLTDITDPDAVIHALRHTCGQHRHGEGLAGPHDDQDDGRHVRPRRNGQHGRRRCGAHRDARHLAYEVLIVTGQRNPHQM